MVLSARLPNALLAFLMAGLVLSAFGAEPARTSESTEKTQSKAAAEHKIAEPKRSSKVAKKTDAAPSSMSQPSVRRPDLRLLLDVSGQASRLDPHNSRAAAVAQLIDALPPVAQAGIWTFGEQSAELVPYGSVDVVWKRTALLATGSLLAEGDQHGFVDALQSASWDVGERSGFERHIIIVSAGTTSETSAVTETPQSILVENFANEFAANKLPVHAVVLPGGKTDPLLKLLVTRTGGMLLEATRADEVGALFQRLTQFTSMPPNIPVDEGAFTVDAGLKEISLRVDGDNARLVLIDPEGQSHTRAKPGNLMRWHDARGFDAITIKRPKAGRWQIRGGETASVVAWGDLALRVEKIPARLFPGNINPINFMLFDGDEPVDDPHFRDIAKASARLVGEGERVPLHVGALDGGMYRVEMVNTAEVGDYVLELRVEGPTFSRKAAVPFKLIHPVKVHVAQRGKAVVAWLELTDSTLDYESLKVAAQYRMPPNPRTLLSAKKMPGGLWQLTVPNAVDDVEIAWSVFGRYHNQKKFELHTEPRRVSVPLEAELVFGFNALGEAVEDRGKTRRLLPDTPKKSAKEGKKGTAAHPPSEMELPLWAAIVSALVIAMIAAGGAWFVMRRPLNPELQAWLDARAPVEAQPT